MTIVSPKRNCRRRCKGCDLCWICRWSYPTSVIVTANPSAPSGGGIWPGDCRQKSVGTYVADDPFTGPYDNGTLEHWPIGTDSTLYGKISPFSRCSALWVFKQTTFPTGDPLGSFPTYAVWRCGGISSQTDLEWVLTSRVGYNVGGGLGSLGNPRIAADTNSTRLVVSIVENLAGWHDTDPTNAVGTITSWHVTRSESFIINFDKPCPTSGTFALDHYQTSVVNQTSATSSWYNLPATPSPSTPTYATHTGTNYLVSIEL